MAKKAETYGGNVQEPREFVSYASKFDLYKGFLDWNELRPSDQDMMILYEIDDELLADVGEFDSIENFVKSTSLKKVQYEGLRSILVYCRLFLEQHGTIDEYTPQEAIQFHLRLLLKDTPIGQRIYEASGSETGTRGGPRTLLDGKTLENVAGDGANETVLHAILNMTWDEAEVFLREQLGTLPAEKVNPPANTPTINVLDRVWNDLEHDERRLVLDAAAMGNLNAVQHLRVNLKSIQSPLREQAVRVLRRKNSWWVRLAQRVLR